MLQSITEITKWQLRPISTNHEIDITAKKARKKGELKEIAFGFVRVQKSGSVRSSRFGAPPPATAGGWIAHKDSQDTSTNSSQSNFGLY